MNTNTVSGNIASFYTPRQVDLSSLKVHFSPKQLGEGDPSSSNVREIVPRTRVGGYVCGKNMFNYNSAVINANHYRDNNGNVVSTSNSYYVITTYPVQPLTKYCISNLVSSSNDDPACRFYYLDNNKEWISRTDYYFSANGITFTTPANCYYVQFQFPNTVSITNMQFEIGEIGTYYEPYSVHPTTVDWDISIGKNILNPATNPLWTGQQAYTINSDGSIDVNGSDGRGWVNDNFPAFPLKKGTYTLSWTGGSYLNYVTSEDGYAAESVQRVTSGSVTFTLTTDGGIKWKHSSSSYPITVRVQLEEGSVATGYEAYKDPPYLKGVAGKNLLNVNLPVAVPTNNGTADIEGSGIDKTKHLFEPYTICVGSSYSNWINKNNVTFYHISNNCVTVNSKGGYGLGFAIPVKPSTKYSLSWQSDGTGYSSVTLYKADGTPNVISNGNTNNSFTTSADDVLAVITFRNVHGGPTVTFSNIQLEEGATITDYEPPTTKVYGGYVDLVTGELWKTWQDVDFSTLTWNAWGSEGLMYNLSINREPVTTMYSDSIPIDGTGDPQRKEQGILGYYGTNTKYPNHLFIQTNITGSGSDINTARRNWIDSAYPSGTLCYKLATPQLVATLTPQQITSLLETNTIWSNADSVEVTYPVIPTCNLEKSRHNILASYPHKVTAESTDGAINNFGTDMVGPMVNLRVGFKPIQSGEGTPSPENVREISGWDSVTICKTGKNIGQVIGYSASTTSYPGDARKLTNTSQGVTISTIDFVSPDTPVTVTASDPSKGYFCVCLNNMIFDHYYMVSFRISNITANPNNISLASIRIRNPAGMDAPSTTVNGDVITAKIKFSRSINTPNSQDIRILNINGMSFTMSEFMVTEADETNTSYEEYKGEIIDIMFPPFGKNYWNPEYMTASAVTYTTTNTGITVTSSSAGTFRHVVFKTSNITPDDIGKTFTFSTNATVTSGQARILVSIRNPNGTNFATLLEKASDTDQTLTGSFTIPSGFPDNGWFQCAFYCTGSAGGSGEVEYSNTQLELGSSATTYEEYIPLYGGYVDPIAGEIIVNRALFTIDGTQTVQVRETYATTNSFRISKTQFPIEPLSYNKDDIANYMSVDVNNTFLIPWTFYCNGTTKALHFMFPKTFTTVAQVQEYFAQNPLQVCVHIEPIHYPIDSNTLLTLRGANNIWSTANGDITATYYTHGDQSTQWLPGEPIVDDNNMILTTSNGYAIGKEDDYIVY